MAAAASWTCASSCSPQSSLHPETRHQPDPGPARDWIAPPPALSPSTSHLQTPEKNKKSYACVPRAAAAAAAAVSR
ncbi:hypothetical protein ACLOJK_027413, partial [Asimina triloba]